jgi:xylulokinase
MDVFLGLDLGTTNCKVLAVDLNGQPVATASAPTPVHVLAGQDGSSHTEYSAEDLWQVSIKLLRQVLEGLAPGQRAAGLAVASMGESGVLVDRDGQPLTSIMPWHDQRPRAYNSWWRRRISETDLFHITGLPIDHIYSANKLLWLQEHAPEAFSRAYHWLCIADWITFRLTGVASTSFSLASRTMLFDLGKRLWSEELIGLMGLPPTLLPTAFPSGVVVGQVTPTSAAATTLPEGLPVATGGHDHLCAALAAEVVAPGQVLDSAGTVEAILVTLDKPVLNAEMAATGLQCGCHTARDRYYLIGGIMAGGVLAWVNRMLTGNESTASINDLMQEAAFSPQGANGVWFLPYLDGSGPPDCAPEAWGAWLGLRLNTQRSDLARAAVEGVSYGIRYLLENLQSRAGVSVSELTCVGGGTRNSFWQQVKADVLGIPIKTPQITDMTAQGAALLAAVGAEAFTDELQAAQSVRRAAFRYAVDAKTSPGYNTRFHETFQKIYPAFKLLPLR